MFCYYAVYYVACTLKRKSMTKEKIVLTDTHRAIDEIIVCTVLFLAVFSLAGCNKKIRRLIK